MNKQTRLRAVRKRLQELADGYMPINTEVGICGELLRLFCISFHSLGFDNCPDVKAANWYSGNEVWPIRGTCNKLYGRGKANLWESRAGKNRRELCKIMLKRGNLKLIIPSLY